MSVGERFSLRWKYPHRIEATILELGELYLTAEVVHRCVPHCELLGLRSTLPLEGRIRYHCDDFVKLFAPMAQGELFGEIA